MGWSAVLKTIFTFFQINNLEISTTWIEFRQESIFPKIRVDYSSS